jgi:hypothetical protein
MERNMNLTGVMLLLSSIAVIPVGSGDPTNPVIFGLILCIGSLISSYKAFMGSQRFVVVYSSIALVCSLLSVLFNPLGMVADNPVGQIAIFVFNGGLAAILYAATLVSTRQVGAGAEPSSGILPDREDEPNE